MDYSWSGSSRGAGISMIPSPRDTYEPASEPLHISDKYQPYFSEGRGAHFPPSASAGAASLHHFPSSSNFSHHGAGRREVPPPHPGDNPGANRCIL